MLRSALATAVFFGGKWVGNVDKVIEASPDGYIRLARVEEKQIAQAESLGKIAYTQEVMLKNQLEMNSFIAKAYGNKELAAKFNQQLETIKDNKEISRDARDKRESDNANAGN